MASSSSAADGAVQPTVQTDSAPASLPRENAAGRSKMSTLAANLVANRTINPVMNGLNYPQHVHALRATSILAMFANIIAPLVLMNYRLLGVQTPTNPADIALLNAISQCIAYDALVATYALLYHKSSRLSVGLLPLFGQNPTIGTNDFPIFITALINSIGPVQLDDVPARGIHVPYLTWASVTACLPGTYATYRVAMFTEAIARSRQFVSASVDIFSTKSSAWWTFHCYPERSRNNILTFSLWSPVKFDSIDNALKLGVLFAKERITSDVGIISFTTTPFYDVNDPPRPAQFPVQVFNYPYFIESQPAYYRIFERSVPAADAPASPTYSPQSPTSSTVNVAASPTRAISGNRQATPGPSGATRSNKRRRLPDGSATEADDDTVLHRVIYHYFDHQVMTNVSDRDLQQWAISLNEV